MAMRWRWPPDQLLHLIDDRPAVFQPQRPEVVGLKRRGRVKAVTGPADGARHFVPRAWHHAHAPGGWLRRRGRDR